jgi:hypothetical protein
MTLTLLSIRVVAEDGTALITSHNDMVNPTCQLDPQRLSHLAK